MDYKQLNGLTLAYMGDAVYEIYIRSYVISLGYSKVNDLHKRVIKFTSGNAQASLMHYLLEIEFLTEEEINIFKRGRNSHVHTVRKNMNIQDYLDATGFEALIGYLYLQENIERIKEIVDLAVKKGGA
jgi:ribonuclease-3 family protein